MRCAVRKSLVMATPDDCFYSRVLEDRAWLFVLVALTFLERRG